MNPSGNRLLITGGSGYLGRELIRQARGRWPLTATYLTQPIDGDPAIDWRRLDVRDGPAVAALVDALQPAAIIHTAALKQGAEADLEAINADGSRHVARAAAAIDAHLIHVSTDVIFDGREGPYTEQAPPNPITAYGHSKAHAERAVRGSRVRGAIVRTSLIYGWEPMGRNTRWIIEALRAGESVRLFTDELRCPIWVRSLAAALLELMEIGHAGVLNVAGAQVLSRYDFGLRLLRFHGIDPAPVIPALSRESGLHRPLDCTLDSSRARALLATPLPGVDEVLV